MTMNFTELPGWDFYVEETSVSVYKVTGRDNQGHVVSLAGQNADELIVECRRQALEIQSSAARARESST